MGTVEQDDGQKRDAEQSDRYLVAGCTPWARRVFDERLSKLPGTWTYVETPIALGESVRAFSPRLVFVLHWRWKVPKTVLDAVVCVGFHLGSFGRYRGGTPLQHQIVAGERHAMLTMYRMTEAMDAGPVYTAVPVELHGSAEAVYARALAVAADKIGVFLVTPWRPEPLVGLGPLLPRRTPAESEIPPGQYGLSVDGASVEKVHDFVRMLDAPGYPYAFLEHGGLRFTFRRAVLYDGRVECDCTITVREDGA